MPAKPAISPLTPIAGPFLTNFINERRIEPWPFGWRSTGARGKDLYEAYEQAAIDAGLTRSGRTVRYGDSAEPVLGNRDFGLVLKSFGLALGHDREGSPYLLTLQTREQVAREQAIHHFEEPELYRLAEESTAHDHGTVDVPVLDYDLASRTYSPRLYDDGKPWTIEKPAPCDCDPGELAARAVEAVQGRLAEYVTRLEQDGTIDRYVEKHFGVYLRWSPDDPESEAAVEEHVRQGWLRQLAEAEAVLADDGSSDGARGAARLTRRYMREYLGLPDED